MAGKNPITSRDIEHLEHQDSNIAQRGTVAKTSSRPVSVHGGMVHRDRQGNTFQSISATQALTALAGGKSPTDPPVIGKRQSKPTLMPGMKSQQTLGLDTDAHCELGSKILAEAALRVRRPK
jgi:hypothetical protein